MGSEQLVKGRVGGQDGTPTRDGVKARLRRWREETHQGIVPADLSVGRRGLSEGVRSPADRRAVGVRGPEREVGEDLLDNFRALDESE